ncbi:MAG: MBL fold metallo-hydrolase [Planctomycetota bacterium]
MKVLTHTGGIASTNCFLVADEEAKRCVLFDAPDHTAGELIREAGRLGWTIDGLWLTHGHFDHIADHHLLPDVPVLLHEADADKLRHPDKQLEAFAARSGFRVPLEIPPREPDGGLVEGQVLMIGSLSCRVIETPGHCSGHVSFYFENDGVLVGGDLIIGSSVGRTDLPDSDHATLEASVRRIMQLPGETRLLPGHGSPSTLDDERTGNAMVASMVGSN